jgi:hypothetical protein
MKKAIITIAVAAMFSQANAADSQKQEQTASGIGIIDTSLTVNESPIPTNTTQNIRQSDYTVKNVPNVLTGSVYPTAPCMGSSQAGAAGVGFGVSFGSSWTDDECGIRETARSFAGMDLKQDALAILCTSKYAAAAPSCKAKSE